MGAEISNFVENFASQFDETPKDIFIPETKFRDLDEWSSMIALIIIAMVDEQYNVKLTGNDIKESNTIEDIYKKIMYKLNG